MRVGALCMTLVLAVVAIRIEEQAWSCGAGIFGRSLQYGIQPNWFNGTFWLEDSRGWGVVAPPGDVETASGETLDVDHVTRYTPEHGLLVELALASGNLVTISFAGSSESSLHKEVVRVADMLGAQALQADLRWIAVDPRNCFYGRFAVVRAVIGASLLVAIVALLRGHEK